MSLGGASSAWADAINLPYSYGFEESSPTGWTKTSCASGTNNYQSGSSSSHSGNYVFKFAYNTNPPQYLISPELAVSTNTVKVSLWYKNPGSYTETFNVGYSTTNTETSSFTWLASDITASSSWTKFEETFPIGTKYIAIKYTANDQLSLYIDDFLVEENETYPKPKDFTFSGYTATSASFTWTNGGEETAWQIAYSTTQGFDAGSVTPVDVTEKPYTLTGLTAETTYYGRIRADYGSSNYSKWSDEISFKPSAAINTTVNDGTTENYYIPFHTNYTDGKIDKSQFIIPAASLSSIADRQITKLTFHSKQTSASFGTTVFKVYLKEVDDTSFDAATFDYSDMEEVYSGTVSISGNEMAIVLDEPFDYSGSNLKVGFEMTTKGSAPSSCYWYGITVDNNASIYSYLYSSGSATSGLSKFLPKMTITSLPQVATVKKPKNLDDTATTTTTATLGWTNGSDETAWQIAYSTDTDFDPDTEGTKVAADANPFTLTELTAGTTYYAYVRAKKAEEYSDWSNKADFTTLAATPVIELSATNHNFGLVSDADAQALTLTISNTGGAALTGLTVTASSGFAVTDAEGNALTATTIDASSTLTVKVKVSALGQQDGTITIDGNEIEAKQVTVSGYKLDDTKILETFASKPSRWTGDWYTYSAANGAYSGTSARTLTTPKITVAEGNVLAIRAKYSYNGGYLTIEGSDDNGSTWTAYTKTINYSSNPNLTDEFKLFILDDVPTTVNKLCLTGYYVYVNALNGFSYANEPVLGIFSNEACTTAQASPATNNFGFAAEAQNQLYYIKNTGNGQIDLTIEQADGFTAAVDDAALTEGEKATLTITMTATEGLHDGTITVTAKNHDNDDVLGTFVINANGGITGTKNNVVLTAFPAGWQNNNWTISNGAARNWSSTSSDLITTTLTVTEGEKLLVEAYKYYSDENSQLSYSYSTDGGSNWSDPVSLTNQLTTSYKIIAISGIPAGNVLMKFSGTYTYIRQIYGFEAFAEPILEFAAEGTTKNFGMITSNTTSDDYTVTNSGTATLEGFGVTCDNSSFDIAITGNVDEIAAGCSATFTVTMNTSDPGEQYGIVTISGTGVADKTFNVKGYVADGTKIYTTFAAKPDRWTNSTSPAWSFSAENGASAGNSGGSYYSPTYATLTSPKITIAEGQKLAISAKLQYSGSYYVTINGSSDNGDTWTAYTKTLNNTQLNNTSYTVVELDDIPTTVNKLQLVGYYVYVNGLNGFTYDDNDPKFAMFSDSECTTPIAGTTATNAWGFVGEDKTATYYIKNTGTGTMSLSKSATPAGFTATLGAASLGAGESTSLVISMANDAENNEGYHAGDVVLTAKDNADNTLGTFTVTSSGVVVSASKTNIDFTTLSAFPAGWEATNWSVTANTKSAVGYSEGTLTTGTYTVAAGESMVIKAKKQYNSGTLSYQYSTDGGETWSSAQSITPSSTSYELIAISNIPAGSAKIKFIGTYIDVERIYGYTAVLEPAMTLSPAATSHDFGMQTTAADYVITVTNSGTADMTNLAAALSGTDADDFEVAVSKTTVPYTGENTATVTVTMKASTEYKEHNATLTISADGLADKVITLSGKTRDASKLFVDFDDVDLPATWDNEGWSIYDYGTDNYLYNSSSTTPYAVTTQALTVTEGESISFDVKAYSSWNSPYLTVRYSYNGGIDWTDFATYAYADESLTTSFVTKTINGLNAGKVVLQFVGTYCGIDNIIGFAPKADEPTISIKKSSATINNGATEAFGSIKNEAIATYTIKNIGQGALTITSPVSATGVATAAVDKTTLANGESATLTITLPVEAPYGEKSGAVTVATSLGDFVINYTATTLNPNALDEQFASGKPAGWYFGGYWEVSSQRAENTASAIADLITEQLAVAGTSDVLTFLAAKSGSSAPTFNVYTSQDRINWTPVDLGGLTLTSDYQDVNISGLAAGDYYVKISGARVKVDNFLGWTKKNNTRDLYVTATSFPAVDKGNNATITATVTSLIADETGVYAKLFVDGAEEATTDAQDIALNGTKTFSFTYAIPENKTAQIKVYYSDDTEAFATAENNMKVNYTLAETDDPGAITAGTFDVVLTRNFNARWNTVCLPFAVTDIEEFFGADAKVYEFNDFAGDALSFSKVTETAAATPYLVYAPAEKEYSAVTLSDVTLSGAAAGTVTKGVVTFHGTYAPIAKGDMTGYYGVTSAGKIAKAGANAWLKGFRAYFEGVPATARIFIDGEATGIGSITADGELQMENVYNLNGQRVENAKKGLYIVNGKKVVVK